jgi:hypothetical protein
LNDDGRNEDEMQQFSTPAQFTPAELGANELQHTLNIGVEQDKNLSSAQQASDDLPSLHADVEGQVVDEGELIRSYKQQTDEADTYE